MTREIVREDGDVGKAVEGTDLEARLRYAMKHVLHELMESEVTELLGAEPWERSEMRRGYRNGTRPRDWETRLGRLTLEVPKLREGGYLPSFLEPRRRAERALVAVVQEAYVHGVSTRKVDDLVRVLGTSVSKSAVSRICQELDEEGRSFRERAIEVETPYVWLDALYEKARDGGHVRSTAVVIAIGVTAEGTRRQLASVVKLLRDKCEKAAEVLENAAEDVLAYMAFPAEHWRRIHSTNPLERLNTEVRRRGSGRSRRRGCARPSCASSRRSSPSRATSGRPPSAATSARPRWRRCRRT